MTELYNDVDVLGAVMADMLSGKFKAAQKKVQGLLKEKGAEIAAYEEYVNEQALAYEDGISEGQGV